jgi:hypothetical protein
MTSQCHENSGGRVGCGVWDLSSVPSSFQRSSLGRPKWLDRADIEFPSTLALAAVGTPVGT